MAHDTSDLRPSWKVLLGLFVASAALQLGLRVGLGLWFPAGEDAWFWGQRAAEVGAGRLVGSRPPLYPLLSWLVGGLPGLALYQGSAWVAAAAGALVAPAAALGVTPLAGRRAGLLAGLGVLALPNLQAAALCAEATTLFALLLGLVLVLASRPGAGAAAACGVALALLVLTKEQGIVYLALLGLPTALARPGGRPWRVAALLGAFALLTGPVVALDYLAGDPNVWHKVGLPLHDMLRLFREGQVPSPFVVRRELDPPAMEGGGGLGLVALTQARRLAWFAGLWLAATPAVLWSAWRRWRTGALEAWRLLTLVAPAAALGVVALLPVLQRHVETALLPVAWGLGLLLPRRRWAGPVVVAALLVQGGWLLVTREGPALQRSARANEEAWRRATSFRDAIPPGATLCSSFDWAGYYLETPVSWPRGGAGALPHWWLVERSAVEHLPAHLLPRVELVREGAGDYLLVRTNDPEADAALYRQAMRPFDIDGLPRPPVGEGIPVRGAIVPK